MKVNPIKKTKEYFANNYNCAQSVLKAFLEYKGLHFKEAPLVAAGFGGGISRRGEICGALSGAIMAIGIIHSQKIKDITDHKSATYESTNLLIKKFLEKHKTPMCSLLVGVNMQDEQARKKASDEGVFKKLCPGFLEDTIRILMEMFPEKSK